MNKNTGVSLAILIFFVLAFSGCDMQIHPQYETAPTVTATVSPTSSPVLAITVVPASTPLCVTANTALTFRTGPGVDFDPITWLANNNQVMPTGYKIDDWWYVRSGKQFGWVRSIYLGACQQ